MSTPMVRAGASSSVASVFEVRVPAEQSEGTRSQVLRWLKSVGDSVAQNEPLIELETDKVTVEVPAPAAGVLREILKGEQEEVGPGDLLGRIETVVAPDAADISSASAQWVGSAGAAPDRQDAHPGMAPSGSAVSRSVGPTDISTAARVSPAVRRLLAEHGLEATAIRGSGPGGRVTVDDVLQAASALQPAPASQPAPARTQGAGVASAVPTSSPKSPDRAGSSADITQPDAEVTGGSHRVPHTAVRKRIAEHMVHSLLHTAPHVTTVFEADMAAVLAHRQRHRDEFARRGVPLTLTAYFLKAAVEAIAAVPEANSRWTESALEVFDAVHIGVATAVESLGLVVPVLRDVQSRDLFEVAQGLEDLVTRARESRLTPSDVRGGTFTISNHGVSGSLVATPIIINQPQSAILGVGKLEKRAVVLEEDGEDRIVARPRCYVTLTIDHRVMDGHRANRFLQTFVQYLTGWPA